MEGISYGVQREEEANDFPFAICPNCNTIQDKPILDSSMHTVNITCSKCKNKFCSYCGGDRHILMSCRKPLPQVRSVGDQYRV